jgi:2-keto-4-pentenoate hydratase
MSAGDVVGIIGRPAMSGALRARQVKKTGQRVRAGQVVGYIVIAALTTWLTKELDEMVDRYFGELPPEELE